jgi:hypothetical protein
MKKQPIREFLLGGPGHDGYAYNADVYCVECGREIIRDLYANDYDMLLSGDTDDSPQPIFFGESPDCKQHCSSCGEYLYGESNEEETDENDDCEASL